MVQLIGDFEVLVLCGHGQVQGDDRNALRLGATATLMSTHRRSPFTGFR
jgi:hypothetical protein